MEREIIFRGKRKDNGKWIEGYYVIFKKEHLIFFDTQEMYDSTDDFFVEVLPETVGQYVQKDQSNKKAFVGDIVLYCDIDGDYETAEIVWDEETEESLWINGFRLKPHGIVDDDELSTMLEKFGLKEEDVNFVVIGNVHEKADSEPRKGRIEALKKWLDSPEGVEKISKSYESANSFCKELDEKSVVSQEQLSKRIII